MNVNIEQQNLSIEAITQGGQCQTFIKPHEKKNNRVFLVQEEKLHKLWNYYRLDEMAHVILYLK